MAKALSRLIEKHSIQVCVGNVENAVGGFVLAPQGVNDLFALGFHALTSGNHIFDKREITLLNNLLRPVNDLLETPVIGHYLPKVKDGISVCVR